MPFYNRNTDSYEYTGVELLAAQDQHQLMMAKTHAEEPQTVAKRIPGPLYNKGGPVSVLSAQSKGTGPVNIGDWTAPMKSKR